MKTVLVLVLAVAIFFALGLLLPASCSTAITVPALGNWGVVSYRGLVAFLSFGFLWNRISA